MSESKGKALRRQSMRPSFREGGMKLKPAKKPAAYGGRIPHPYPKTRKLSQIKSQSQSLVLLIFYMQKRAQKEIQILRAES